MDDLRPDALATVAARVVAWHNRHPLARRITAEQVQSVGYVALPYLAPADPARGDDKATAPEPVASGAGASADQGKSLRERALERAQAQPAAGKTGAVASGQAPTVAKATQASRTAALKPAFTEDFIAPLPLSRVVRWAAEHGAPAGRPPRDGPVREVAAERSLAGPRTGLITLYVLTAMVEVGGKRVRMLLGGGSSTAVMGSRLWSLPRLATGTSLLGGVAAAAGAGVLWLSAQPAAAPQASAAAPVAAISSGPVTSIASIRPPALRASAAAELATRQAVMAASSPAPVAQSGAAQAPEVAAHAGTPVPAAAPALSAPLPVAAAAASAPATAPVPTRPLDVEPTLGRIDLSALGLPRGQAGQAVLRERRLAAPASANGPGAAAPAAVPAATAAAPMPAPPTAAAPDKPHAAIATPGVAAFAVTSRQLRTRAEAEQIQSAMRALLVASGHNAVHVELVPEGEDWRVVGWPFAQRTQADSARSMLATRGMRVSVIDF